MEGTKNQSEIKPNQETLKKVERPQWMKKGFRFYCSDVVDGFTEGALKNIITFNLDGFGLYGVSTSKIEFITSIKFSQTLKNYLGHYTSHRQTAFLRFFHGTANVILHRFNKADLYSFGLDFKVGKILSVKLTKTFPNVLFFDFVELIKKEEKIDCEVKQYPAACHLDHLDIQPPEIQQG